MKKIIIAGAGNGGLSAAANLAKYGFDVTVIEAKEKRIWDMTGATPCVLMLLRKQDCPLQTAQITHLITKLASTIHPKI